MDVETSEKYGLATRGDHAIEVIWNGRVVSVFGKAETREENWQIAASWCALLERILVTAWCIPGPQPENIPAGWSIFNSPRPLLGDKTWVGKHRHGSHYGAVDPSGPHASIMIIRNVELNGWLCRYVDKDDPRLEVDGREFVNLIQILRGE